MDPPGESRGTSYPHFVRLWRTAAGLSASDLARNPPKPDDVLPSRASSVPPFIHGQARGFRAEANKKSLSSRKPKWLNRHISHSLNSTFYILLFLGRPPDFGIPSKSNTKVLTINNLS